MSAKHPEQVPERPLVPASVPVTVRPGAIVNPGPEPLPDCGVTGGEKAEYK
jgi:hypothetical protein